MTMLRTTTGERVKLSSIDLMTIEQRICPRSPELWGVWAIIDGEFQDRHLIFMGDTREECVKFIDSLFE